MLLEDLQVILKVAEFGSITGAATNLDMRTATASAAVKRVEAALGAELFVRTTRQLRLSSAGERYIPECQQALMMLEQAKQNMRQEQGIIDGEVRIAMSSDLGRNLVTPWLDEFLESHPNVALRSNISDSNIDFYRDKVDMALRYGAPSDSSMSGFKICNVPRLVCASPSYIKHYGAPEQPEQLKTHAGLCYQLHEMLQNEWQFQRGEQNLKVKLSPTRVTNDGDLVRRWCVAGKGVAIKSCLDMSQDLLAGHVVPLMQEYQPTPTELWLICPSRQSITPTVRLLRDLFRERTAIILQQLVAKGWIDCKALAR
ncbi:LysR family transcriptional regulator [Shewanella gelidii]|uniref:LysR family transcriptional regulator n=1 Tax=Shewanella gelidii TaxID=1642821 RepID=A0A917JJT3_9GAMM|nr:LysR family transcriptional regulator [Shewanella gelidii]MCL1096982.1 LysR substrate-binding domain-containing protein [Shewanella gelidii]GGI71681.1 LysR family transcriptional regulator [Shewanella gelidii]